MTRPKAVSLAATDIHLAFGPHKVLRGVDLEVPAGTTAAVIGPSGSGKSTLLRTLNRLYEPDRGDILLDGRSVLRDNPDQLRQRIGMVFQHFNLFPNMTVIENIMEAPVHVLGIPKAQARERALQLLEKVGLPDKPDAHPSELSGGQQQRVAIARALAMEPEILLLDEVTSALDPEVVGEVLSVLRDIARETDVTMLIVTHEMHFAREVSNRVLMFDGGKIVEEGDPESLFNNPKEQRTRDFISAVS